MDMLKCFLFTLLATFAFTFLVHAQDQSGFISLDCGIPADSGYTDTTTGLNYISDATFIDSGISKNVSAEFKSNTFEQQFWNVRSFPQGIKNCYTLTPPQLQGYKYLIRARFMYGNYDAQNQIPEFDLYLGVNLWDSVKLNSTSKIVSKEIIHVPTSNYTNVCLVNKGLGTPFISALELRLLKNTTYVAQSGSLSLFLRLDFGSTTNQVIRYKDDVYDRIWAPFDWPEMAQLNTSLTIDSTNRTDFQPPSAIMRTAVTPQNASDSIQFFWEPEDPTSQFYVYLHFSELEVLQANQTREFNISLNGILIYGPLAPNYLYTSTMYTEAPVSAAKLEYSLNKTQRSTLPPIINGIEVFMVKQFSQSQTEQGDVDAIMKIKSAYGVKRNWQGDPCAPKAYSWDGLNCSYNGYDPPRIISLNLSSSGLSGVISPSISNLKLIQYLDLSNNNLTGPVPDFLSQLSFLTVLNLTGNKLTGSVPAELIEKSKNGLMSLSVEENPNLCSSASCQKTTTKKKNDSAVVPLVASVAAVAALLAALAIFCILKRRKQRVGKEEKVAADFNKREELMESNNRQFTYAEVLSITNNFERVLGQGGFGTVFHGYLDATQVAVKMLSKSSIQGYKQFHAEVKLLMRVHHRNLTSLVGYCDDGENMGLIYEYMANGNLQEHLSGPHDKHPNLLSWEERLRIAVDAAQGLEYLHNGCKPPIVHRDVKSTNILLNEKFQAKVADFGLSRVFAVEEGTHVSTVVAGTPGYLDPEYYVSSRLNEKSDVFGFGVVLLEIITSQPAITKTHEKIHISKWVSDTIAANGDVRGVVDPKLHENYDINSVWKAVEVATACVSAASNRRPTMNDVVMELKQCLATETGRKEGHETETKGSIEMVSLIMDTGMSPGAR